MIFSSLDYIHNDHFYHQQNHNHNQKLVNDNCSKDDYSKDDNNDERLDSNKSKDGDRTKDDDRIKDDNRIKDDGNDERLDSNSDINNVKEDDNNDNNNCCTDDCSSSSSSSNNNNNDNNNNNNNAVISINLNNTNISIQPKQLIYLTSDATDILYTLDKNCTYIIGGIVDRNRFKNLTYYKASNQYIRTAKLPIQEYFHLTKTHILTVNHVYEILLNFSKSNNWYDALKQVIPARKGLNIKSNNEVKCIDN